MSLHSGHKVSLYLSPYSKKSEAVKGNDEGRSHISKNSEPEGEPAGKHRQHSDGLDYEGEGDVLPDNS